MTLAALMAISAAVNDAAWAQSLNRKQQKLEKVANALGVRPKEEYNNNDRNDRNNNDRNDHNRNDRNNDRNDRNNDLLDNNDYGHNNPKDADNKDPLAKAYTANERIKANTAAYTKLSDEEKKLIFYCNLARMDGRKFAENILKHYLKGKNNLYIKSLYADLEKVSNLPMLNPDRILCEVCASHCADMDKNGFFDHYSSNGTDPFVRMEKSGYKGNQRAENVSAGYKNAIDICIQLLVDDGVPSLAHRNSILGSKYKVIGVAITKHKKWRHCCTMDLGDICFGKM